MDTLGEAYTPEALRAIIKGSRKHIPKTKLAEVVEETPVENLIDFVQEKLTRKSSAGRSKIQSVSDLKRLASSLLYLQENGLLDRATLEKKVAEVSQQFSKLNSQIKQIEGQLDENAKMQQHIIDYKKTRDVYMAYHKAGYSKKFLSEHESDIIKHKAAKKFFDDRGMTKWPKIKKLRADFDELVAKKRTLNAERKKVEKEVRELQMAQYFVDRAYDVMPFILDDKSRTQYLAGIQDWASDIWTLTGVVQDAQDRFEAQVELQKLAARRGIMMPDMYEEDDV